jgi:hypothetical protein
MDDKARTERMVLLMACAIMGIGFAYLFAVTFLTIPTSGIEHAKTITGFILGVTISSLINYFWGSSKGSAAKSDAIEKELAGTKPPVTTQTGTFRSTETIDKTTESVAKPPEEVDKKP